MKNLKDNLLEDIARHSVWDYESIKKSFSILNSIDLLLIAIAICSCLAVDLDSATNLIKSTLNHENRRNDNYRNI